jgi:hypothetical protein
MFERHLRIESGLRDGAAARGLKLGCCSRELELFLLL